MFAKNVANLIVLFIKEGQLALDMDDEIIAGTLECDGGQIIHPMAREIFGLPALAAAETPIPEPEPVAEGSNA